VVLLRLVLLDLVVVALGFVVAKGREAFAATAAATAAEERAEDTFHEWMLWRKVRGQWLGRVTLYRESWLPRLCVVSTDLE
jgi:hypothetical protein